MDLSSVTLCAFRRFASKCTLQTNGKLVALLGPNEAGKSSLLDAIRLLADDNPPKLGDFSRGADTTSFFVEGRYFLSDEELREARLAAPGWLIVRKAASGQRSYRIYPAPPIRDTGARTKLLTALRNLLGGSKVLAALAAAEDEEIDERWADVEPILSTEAEDLSTEEISDVGAFVALASAFTKGHAPSATGKVIKASDAFKVAESALNPNEYALRVLKKRVPEIVVFGEEARDLRSEYSFDDLATTTPLALDNLCDLAGLKLKDVVSAHAAGDAATLATIEHRANRRLEERFATDWQQSGVHVSLRFQTERLLVQVVNEQSEFTSLAERSDGLRQFVALQAFSAGAWRGRPIMLIDEAEQRLHYDAQADLVQMLARQQVASKVIYTTHSAGCLPEDLGYGVRLARPSADDDTRSEVRNKFWADNDPGFEPLLFGMGASTLAFFPTRNAVLVEGPSDMLLLPTMMRRALGTDVLGFQFVPGLSYSAQLEHSPAIGKSAGILYLVDGDDGGGKIKKKLTDSGIPDTNIFVLRTRDGGAVEVEDFLNADLFISALNKLMAKRRPAVDSVTRDLLPSAGRMAAAEKIYRQRTSQKLPKVQLAYEVLDLVSEDPRRDFLDRRREATFKALAKQILKRFGTTE